MIKTLVLDLDGPLLDGRYRHYHCYSDILQSHGFVPIPIEPYWEGKRKRVNRKELLALSDAETIYDTFLIEWSQQIESRKYLVLDRLQRGVSSILQGWKKQGIGLLLATLRNNPANLHWQLGELGLASFLDQIIVVEGNGGQSKAAKVKPFLSKLYPGEAIWVGDTEVDIHSARELGLKVCALSCGLRTAEYLRGLSPDLLEADLSSFAERLRLELRPPLTNR